MILGLKKIECNWIHIRNYSLIIILIIVPLLVNHYPNELAQNVFITSAESNSMDESAFPDYSHDEISDSTAQEKITQDYNPGIGKIVREFCRYCTSEESITKIAFSPDNRLIAGGTDNGKIFIFDITDGKTKHLLSNSNHKIKNLEWTADSRTLIAIGQDSELNYWNVSSGELSSQISVHQKIIDIANIDLSNDGKTLVIASVEKTISLWDVNGTFLNFLTLNTSSTPFDIRFSPEDSLIALYTVSGSILLWNRYTSELVFQIQASFLTHGLTLSSKVYKGNYIDFSIDSKYLFLARDVLQGLKIIDLGTGTEISKLYPQEDVLSVASSKNKNLIIIGSDTDVEPIKIYDYLQNKTILQIQDDPTIAVDFSFDGTLVATVNAGGTVRVWNIILGTELYSFKAHSDNIIQTKFLNSSILVSTSKDDSVIVWKDNQMLYQIRNASMIKPHAVAITETPENDILVAIGTDYGKIFLFNNSEPMLLREITAYVQNSPALPKVISVDFSTNSTFFVSAGEQGYIKIWNSYSTELVKSIYLGQNISSVNAYFIGNNKIIGGGDLEITIWDLQTSLTQSYSVVIDNTVNNPNFNIMKLSADQTMVVAAYDWKYIVVLNLTDSKIRIFTINGLIGELDFEFTPDNKYLLELAGEEQLLLIWDVETSTEVFSTYVNLPNPFNGDLNTVDWTLVVSYKQENEIAFLDMTPLKNENIKLFDFDSDGMSDMWEQQHSLQNDNYYDRFEDPDTDQILNWEEYLVGTNPQSSDTDGDGISDTYEKQYKMNPLVNDANGDVDGDGMSNLYEYEMRLNSAVNDSYFDYDNDGLTNIQEFQYHTDVYMVDTDGDGMNDKWEVVNGLNPTDPGDALLDNDLDGISNFDEYRYGTDPNSFISVPLFSLNYFYLLIVLTSIIVL